MDKKILSSEIKGERIYLKKHSLELAETMFSYVNEDRERLAQFLPWTDFIKSVEDERNYIKSTLSKWNICEHFDYGIFTHDHTYMGNIGVHSIRWPHDCAEIGYWLLGKFEGQGYMTEAVKILEQHLFAMGFHRVQIKCSDLNHRSAGVPQRCGYLYEGTLRDEIFEQGQYRNTKLFSKLATDHKRV